MASSPSPPLVRPPRQRPPVPTVRPLPKSDNRYPLLRFDTTHQTGSRKKRPRLADRSHDLAARPARPLTVPVADWVPPWEAACAREDDILHPPRAAVIGHLSAEEAGLDVGGGDRVFVRALDAVRSVGSREVVVTAFPYGNRVSNWEDTDGWEDDVDGFVLGQVVDGQVREGNAFKVGFGSTGESVGVCISYLARVGVIQFRGDGQGGVWIVVVERDFSSCSHPMPSRVLVTMAIVARWVLSRNIGGGARDEGVVDVEWFNRAVARNVADDDGVDVCAVREVEITLSSLPVTLRGYQKRAVAWALSREKGKCAADPGMIGEPWAEMGCEDVQGSQDWEGLQVLKRKILVNVVDGNVVFNETDSVCPWKFHGSMLCDEMGLGKSLVCLSLAVANPRGLPAPPAPMQGDALKDRLVCLECAEPISKQGDEAKAIECRECQRVAHPGCLESSKKRHGYVCRECCKKCVDLALGVPMKSNATLVVVPQILLAQWIDELGKHGPAGLEVVVFEGVMRGSGYQPLYQLIAADIVLTTFAALSSDVHVVNHMEWVNSRARRHERRYYYTPTPLLAVEWHRICIDEAQQVGMSAHFEMACALKARLRWCVTGTPIHRSPADLLSILKFLRVEGLSHHSSWLDGLVGPACRGDPSAIDRARLVAALRRFVWRTNKSDVDKLELLLPPQTVEVVRIDFGVVERYFYDSALHNCRDQMSGSNSGIEGVSRALLERLRQACCHPQVGSGGRQLRQRRSNGRVLGGASKTSELEKKMAPAAAAQLRAKEPMSISQVLTAMVRKAALDCEDAQRILVASCNGLAGVMLLRSQPADIVEAIRTYRAVLDLNEKNKVLFKMDRIQILHVLHNLRFALSLAADMATEAKDEGIASLLHSASQRTHREESIDEELKRRRAAYLLDSRGRLSFVMSEFHETQRIVDEKRQHAFPAPSDVADGGKPWWALAFGIVVENGTSDVLLGRVVTTLLEENQYSNRGNVDLSTTMASRMHTFSRMVSTVEEKVTALADARDACLKGFVGLPGAVEPTAGQISESGMCRTCRDFEASGTDCAHCRASPLLKAYERELYLIRSQDGREKKGFDVLYDNNQSVRPASESNADPIVSDLVQRATRGTRERVKPREAVAPMRSELEKVMRELAVIVRRKGDAKTIEEMDSWFQMLGAMKTEFSVCKMAFDAQKEMLAEFDELDQALQRLTLADPGFSVQQLSRHQRLFTVTPFMIPSLHAEFSQQKSADEAMLQAKRGELIYLSSLMPEVDKGDDEVDSEEVHLVEKDKRCAICLMELGSKVGMYACAHFFCPECVNLLISRAAKNNVKSLSCPSCRKSSKIDEINFVLTTPSNKLEISSGSQGASSSTALPSSDASSNDCVVTAERPPPRRSQHSTVRDVIQLYPDECASTFDDPSVEVSGEHLSSKITAIVRVLMNIERKGGGKAIIFSQWAEVLKIVSHALDMNGIEYVSFASVAASRTRGRGLRGGAAALENFKKSESCKVLLMPLGKGAAGLNITEASHVFLVEPSLSPSIEAQAISRVHRLSQTKHTYVHRFIVSNTVEDRVRRIAVSRQDRAQVVGKEEICVDDVATLLE